MPTRAPSVSVVIPTHNRADLLGRSLRSVLAQTFQDFEAIVVDDGSTDGTADVVAGFRDPRLVYHRLDRNRGAAAARNEGIRRARGEFLAFQDSDDEWLPENLARHMAAFDSGSPDLGVVYSDLERVPTGGASRHHRAPDLVPGRLIDPQTRFYQVCNIGIQSAVIRRRCFDAVGLFDIRLPALEDLELFIRLSRRCAFFHIPEPLVRYHETEGLSKDFPAKWHARGRILRRYAVPLFFRNRAFFFQERDWLRKMRPEAERQRAARAATRGVPAIAPPPDGATRPFWSVMIPTFNPNPDFLEQTLRSVLADAPGPEEMEIALVDDGSDTFDAEAFLRERGLTRVSARRHARLGIGGSWNACVRQARGRWVHLLHQDDVVLPGFYRLLRAACAADPRLGAAFCHTLLMDGAGATSPFPSRVRPAESGVLQNWVEYVFVGLSFLTPAIVVRRAVYEELGGFNESYRYALDWDMWKRIAARFPVWHEAQTLVCHRRHGLQETRRLMRSGENIAEIRRSIRASRPLLRPADADGVTRRTQTYYAVYALEKAAMLLDEGDVAAAFAQWREGLRLRPGLVARRTPALARRLLRGAAGKSA